MGQNDDEYTTRKKMETRLSVGVLEVKHEVQKQSRRTVGLISHHPAVTLTQRSSFLSLVSLFLSSVASIHRSAGD